MTAAAIAVRPGAVFALAKDLAALPASLALRNAEWGALFAVTGRHTVAQIGEALGLAPAARDPVFVRLLELGLVEERAVSLAEYLKASATTGDGEPVGLARFLRAGAVLADGPPPALDPPRPAAAPFRALPSPPPVAPAPLATPAPPVTAPPPAPPTTIRRLSLRALLRFILGRAADVESGQLDVYRVFIRVDTALLKRNGITTLRFEDDRLVADHELQQALLASVERTLGQRCPADVFV